jgi:hypothetical protein
LWNDEAIGPTLITIRSSYFFIGMASVLVILLAKILGFPASPLLSEWPTHGWYFQIVDVVMMFLVLIVLQVHSTFFIKAALVFVLLATLVDVYSLIALTWWLSDFFTNTLTPAARAHQSVLQTVPYIIVLVAILFFQLSALTSLAQVVSLLPDLKLEYNIGHRDANGDMLDDEDVLFENSHTTSS